MDRREFLTARRKTTSRQHKTTAKPFRTESGIMAYTGAWTINEVTHLLKRTMFGATKADIDHFLSGSMSQAVDELLNPSTTLPAPPVNDYSGEVADTSVGAGQTWVNNPVAEDSEDLNDARSRSFKKWWIGTMINQDRSIREKLTLFWANHFGTQVGTIKLSHFVYKHNDLLRKSCLGNFKQFVKDVTIDGGMLRFLNESTHERRPFPDRHPAIACIAAAGTLS